MKFKAKSTRKYTRLVGETARSEELIYAEAECVKGGCHPTLFPLFYGKSKKGYRFECVSTTARPLKEVLRDPLPPDRFEAMLLSFLKLAQACDTHHLSLQRVCFHEQLLFFDPASYTLRFAYAPVRGNTEVMPSPLAALQRILPSMRFSDEAYAVKAQHLLDYARRSAVFAWPDYEALLIQEGIIQPRMHSAGAPVPSSAPTDHRHLYGFDFVTRRASMS